MRQRILSELILQLNLKLSFDFESTLSSENWKAAAH